MKCSDQPGGRYVRTRNWKQVNTAPASEGQSANGGGSTVAKISEELWSFRFEDLIFIQNKIRKGQIFFIGQETFNGRIKRFMKLGFESAGR